MITFRCFTTPLFSAPSCWLEQITKACDSEDAFLHDSPCHSLQQEQQGSSFLPGAERGLQVRTSHLRDQEGEKSLSSSCHEGSEGREYLPCLNIHLIFLKFLHINSYHSSAICWAQIYLKKNPKMVKNKNLPCFFYQSITRYMFPPSQGVFRPTGGAWWSIWAGHRAPEKSPLQSPSMGQTPVASHRGDRGCSWQGQSCCGKQELILKEKTADHNDFIIFSGHGSSYCDQLCCILAYSAVLSLLICL